MEEPSSLRRVLERVRALRDRATPALLAIDGLAGAGKSTLADALLAHLDDVSVVRLDNFYRPAGGEVELAPEQRLDCYFDWQRLRDQALTPLARGEVARFEPLDWVTDGPLPEPREVEPASLVVVEGVFALLPALRDAYALTIFVDTPPRERRKRLEERGPLKSDWDEWYSAWSETEDWYVEHHRPWQHTDLVVPGL